MGSNGLQLSYDDLAGCSWAVALLRRPATLSDDAVLRMRRLLVEEELERFDAMPTTFGRSSFLLGRTLLRHTIVHSIGLPSSDLALVYSDHGKPHLRSQTSLGPLFFNLSHSRNLVALAASVRGEVGMDVEDIEGRRESLAKRVLRADETELLAALSPRAREGAFVQLWTIKEACIKARGERLSAMRTIDASLEPSGINGDVYWWTVGVESDSRAAVALRAIHPGPGGTVFSLGLNDLLASA